MSRSRRSPGPVQVRLVVLGWVEVHHAINAVDVESSSGDVGGDKDLQLVGTEVGEGLLSLTLSKITVDRGGVHTFFLELFDQSVRAALRATKNDRLVK